MQIKPIIVMSKTNDSWFNLALEEYLLNKVKDNEIIMYLWINEKTVVIGRNQNAWKECAWKELDEDGGKLSRRLSGGGAVFHDLGNMNFTFIMKNELFDIKKQEQVIINALKPLGINAEFSGRNDMLINGRKFSGHAYYKNNKNSYHHGTLMVDCDLERMGQYLRPSEKKITSKGVNSVRSRVINVKEANKNVTIEIMQNAMKKAFSDIYGKVEEEFEYTGIEDEIKALHEKYGSWDWRFGNSPKFDIAFTNKFPWAEIEFGFNLEKGKIKEATVYTDSLDVEIFDEFKKELIGKAFNEKELVLVSRDCIKDENKLKDIIDWIITLDI